MKKLYFLILFLAFSLIAQAQETSCSDGVDNDGDGFIDCFDSDCGGNTVCQGTYIGNDTDCEIPQPPGSNFSMTLENQSNEHVSSTHGRFVIGDMGHPVDGKDGIPEIVTAHTADRKIYILDGQTLDIKYEATSPNRIDRYDIAIADVRNNGCASIFVAEVATERVCTRFRSNGSCREWDDVTKHYVSSWDCQANFLWRQEVYARPFTLALADFDADGRAELYFRNQILDAATGEVHIAGSGDWSDVDGGPVAVDILADSECADCSGLELVAGGQIYSVGLNAPGSVDGGTLTLVREFNNIPGLIANDEWHTKSLDLDNDEFVNSQTSIADFDLDGHLDVLMTGTSQGGKTTIFYWNVRNNTADIYRPANNWKYGAGRLNLADLDGDGQMNVAFVSGSYLYALDENLDLLWRIAIDEETSGYTSTTVFDFNNDGAAEIVYRDETYLYIIKGDGTFSPPINCKSLTSNDYPIVADVDADGSTEICVICQDNFDESNYSGANEGVIRTYTSANEPWVSSRKVWNQHGYFNVNVNDDLTIPQVQQKHHVVFSEDVCGAGENRVLNSFLNQSAILNTDGCKTYPSADISFVANPNLLNITPPTCPDVMFHVSFTIRNTGSLDVTADIPITFYNGDPTLAGAVKLGTQVIPVGTLEQGDQLVVPDLTVPGTGGPFTLFAVLNDDGSTVPTPIVMPNSGIEECNLGNNIASVSVNPQVFQLTTSATDHVQCGAGPSPPNGSAKAYKAEGAVEQTVGYTFYWFDGNTAGAPGSADHIGSQWTGLLNGTYTVYALHDAYQCGSDTVQVVVGQQALSISATVNVDQPYTNCNNPDGQLSVTPDSGNLNDFTYEWFEGTVFGTSPTLSDSSVLRFTEALTYSVLITQKSSGCETLESGTVPDLTITPSVTTAFTAANCVPPNSGQASANVGGVTAGYTFYWYDGSTSKPTEDFLGHTYPNITAGNYTVMAEDNTTGCISSETVVTVPAVTGIAVTANITAQQTSCTTPNGAASANVGGTTAGYSFRWFQGNNTINQIGTNPAITALAAGHYTVQATNLATGCTDTELITIVDNIQIPTVTPSVISNQTNCFPPDGSLSATASGSPGPYQFYWFDGNIGTPDTAAADFKGANYAALTAGHYTVVAVGATTRCASARAVVPVLNQTVIPVIESDTVNQTSCLPGNPNGQASATVGGVTAGFKFRWFSGADTTTFLTQNPAILNRAAGTYTVKAVNLTTGCLSTKPVVINDASAKPALSLDKDDNTICSPTIGYTGEVRTSFVSNPNAQPGQTFVYTWWRNGVLIAGQTGPSITGLNAGNYAVSVENQTLGCASDSISVVVADAVDLPVVTTMQVSSTNCTPALANGQAQVTDVDGQGTGAPYTFQWHAGTDMSTPIAGQTGATLPNIQGGPTSHYTVAVTNGSTGCQTAAIVQVVDAKALPLFTLTPSPNSVCDESLTANPYNGSVAAAITNQGTSPISDYRFDWTDEETGTVVFSAVGGAPGLGETLTQRDSSYYTLVIEQLSTGCISAPATSQVTSNATLPDIAADDNASTNCDPALADGGVQVTDVDGLGTPANFTFEWRKGNTLAGILVANTAASPDTLQGGAGHFYTVLVTNTDDGCQNTETIEVEDDRVLPLFTLTPSPNSVCDESLTANPYNGSVAAAITNQGTSPISDYRFDWTDEETGTVVFSAVGGAPGLGEALTQRDSSYYTLVIEQVSTGCISAPVTSQVTTNATLPDIAADDNASTNCDPALADGGVQVTDVDGLGTPANFTFEWRKGNTLAGMLIANTAASPDTLQGGAGHFYTVLVTNTDDGCQNTETIEVGEAIVLPDISLTPTANTVCDDAFAQFDGSISAMITNQGAFPLNDYQFDWTDQETGTVVFSASGGASAGEILSNRDSSVYTLVVTQVSTGCASAPETAEILPDFYIPVINIADTPQTACVGTNGILAATIDETAIGGAADENASYLFVWHETNLAGPVVATTTATNGEVNQLAGNSTYAVHVTRQATGCVNTATSFVTENIVLPVPAIVATDQTGCAPADGQLVATVVPPPSQTYTFFWMKEQPFTTTTDPDAVVSAVGGSAGSPNRMFTGGPGIDTDTHGNITYGNYTLVVRDDYTQCVSLTGSGTIADETASDISFAIANRPSACADTDGVLEFSAARVDLSPSNFVFEIYLGGPTNTITPIDYNSTPPNPPVFDPLLNDGSPQPVVSFPQAFPPVGTGVNASQANLASNMYTVISQDDFGCRSVETFFLPFLDAHEIDALISDSKICPYTVGDGSIALKAVPPPSDPGLNQTRFTFTLYEGANANPANILMLGPSPDPSLTGTEICGNLLDDDGDLLVDEGCPYTNPYTWPLSVEDCDDGLDNDADGEADALDSDCSGRLTAERLAPGFYTLEIQENVTAANCKVYQVIEIKATALPPVITMNSIIPNSACDLSGADGAIEINVDKDGSDPSVGLTYDIDMALDPNNVFPLNDVSAGDYTASQLEPATYTFSVLASNGCQATKAFDLPHKPAFAEILSGNISIVDAEFCDAALETSAKAEVLRLSIATRNEDCFNAADDDGDGDVDNADSDCSDNLNNYTFEWYTDAALTQVILPQTAGDQTIVNGGEVLSNAGSPATTANVTTGSYYVVATKTSAGVTGGLGCTSVPVKVDIGDKTVDPVINLFGFDDTSCDEINFEGRIEIEASTASFGLPAPYSNPGDLSAFRYEWDAGNPHVIANTGGNNGNRSNAEPDNDVAGNLRNGTYSLVVINENTGCRASASAIINEASAPSYTIEATHLSQTLCIASGSIQVNDVLLGGVSDGTGNFDYQWYRNSPATAQLEDGASTPINATLLNTANYSAIGAGSYFIVAKRKPNIGLNNGSGCESAPLRVDIEDDSVDPTVVLTPSSNTACDVSFEGAILVTVTDPGSAATGTYQYDWDAANPVDIEGGLGPVTANNDGAGVDDNPVDLEDGLYRVVVRNNASGCISNAQTTILRSETPIVVASATPIPQAICDPDGSITVGDISVAGVVEADHTAFDFTWYRDNTTSAPVVGASPGADVLDVNNYAGIGAGTYFVKVKRTAGRPGSGCESAPLRVDIEDDSVDPTVVLTPSSNTACDVSFEGAILVTVTDPGSAATGTYQYDWDAANPVDIEGGLGPVTANNDGAGVDDNPVDLEDGLYRVVVRNNASGCITNAQTTILRSETPIVVASATPIPQAICGPDGSITVGDISVAGVVEGDHTVFDFTWYRDNTTSAPVVGASPGADVLDVNNYAGIGAGTYFVKVKRTTGRPGSGCESAPLLKVIEDAREYPVVTFNTVANTSCDDANYDASITVFAETDGLPGSNYSFDWTKDPGGTVVIADESDAPGSYMTVPGDNVGPGLYEITVTNLVNLCATNASVTLLQNTTPLQIWDVDKLDQTDCAPFNGSITINTMNSNHVSVTGSYTFAWAKEGVALAPVPDNILTGVDAGVYSVVGTKTSGLAAGCVTSPFSVTLLDLTEKPVLELQSLANFACDPALANGEISGVIFEGSTVAPAADYNLQWFAGKNVTSGPVLGAGDMLMNQAHGHYTLRAVDNVSPNRGCDNSASLAIDFDETSFSLSVATTDQSFCAPGQNGSVAVTGITEVRNGVSSPAADLTVFGFQWTDETGTAHPSTPTFVNGASAISNLLAGDYLVEVRNALGCTSTATTGVVDDQTVPPVITLDNYLNPAVCVLPETPGYLQVSADNNPNFSDYTFEWFEGPDDTGAVISGTPELSDILYNQPLEYTVRVTNNNSHCVSLDTYRFSIETVEVKVLASAVGRTNCLSDDGSLFATTLDGTGALYNYEWYAGPAATGTPVYTTKEVTGAPIGQYTVIAVNPNHAFCNSTPYTTRITDDRVLPPVVVVQKNPLTYCDPANPNGVAFASVNGQVNGYVFDWFEGAVGGAPIYTGPEVANLTATSYTVRATDVLTGCEETQSILIDNDPIDVVEPTVVVVSHHTNCVVPDGILSASVDGITASYLLQWYDGASVRSVADATGEFYRDLEEGFYTTTATDNVSGCVSDPVVTEVLPFQEKPEFDVETVPTNCEQDIGEASVAILNDVQVSSIIWEIDGLQEAGARVSQLPKGEFSVTVTTFRQCFDSKTFVIEPEVLVFNGVSRNNDGQNDIFEIACIQDFPANNVKIFNRAGTLVYEANGYDNQDVFFDGVSNRGINLLGTELPDGTYFYIIDKRNGSKPMTGYLELLR